MKAALVVNNITADIDANLLSIVDTTHKCADSGCDLILFPETAVTGLINNDNPAHDLPFGQTIPGPITNTLSKITRERSVYLAIGILEKDGGKLYDSAVLLAPDGEIVLKYRRIDPHWHSRKADPNVYCQGNEIKEVKTPLGKFVFLICGDLFDDNLAAQAQKLRPDWLLFPFARSFADGTYDRARWDAKEEKPEYIKQAALTEATVLMVNCIDTGGSFGGAMVVSKTGKLVAELPIGTSDVLYVEL